MSDYDHWLLPPECKETPSNIRTRIPDLEDICMNCGEPILDEKGRPVTSFDARCELDTEWQDINWFYWHEVC